MQYVSKRKQMVKCTFMKPAISYPDFEKLDIRVGTVVDCESPDWSKKLLRLEVDFGEFGKRIIFSGIKQWYSPDEFVGKQFPFLVNLEPKKMGEEESQGMMLAADVEGKPILLHPEAKIPEGSIVR